MKDYAGLCPRCDALQPGDRLPVALGVVAGRVRCACCTAWTSEPVAIDKALLPSFRKLLFKSTEVDVTKLPR